MPSRTVTHRLTFLLGCALLCVAIADGQRDTAQAAGSAPGGAGSPIVLTAPPASPDPAATYLFYLHGRIVQEQGRQALSPDYGPYLYDEILARLAAGGVTVISEARPAGTVAEPYAERVASQVRALVAAGVPEARITVAGASMGAWITLAVSNRVDLPGIGYVAMAICGDDTDSGFEGGLHGDVLSIYEAGDSLGQSCAALFDRSALIGRHDEMRLETGLRHGFLYRPLSVWVDPVIAWALDRSIGAAASRAAAAGGALRFSSADSPTALRDRLAADASLTEVVLTEGTYRGGLTIPAPLEPGARPAPLLIRPAPGAAVVFDGSEPLPRLRRLRDADGVFWCPLETPAGEPPAIFDPDARVRYTYAADAAAVARFPGTYVLEAGRLLVHPPDGRAPRKGALRRSLADQGLAIERARVTVLGIEFRNFLARAKWSAGVQAYADDVVLVGSTSENASIGFALMGARSAVLSATARDVGGGVYLAGEGARVEGCRLTKRRDGYQVPTYVQDDAGIQFYYPARGGSAVGNLAVGFGTGLLIKAERAPYRVEGNTLVGGGDGIGFLATDWHPEETLRANVVSGFALPIQLPPSAERRQVGGNCYAPWKGMPKGFAEPGSVVGDPLFSDPAAGDYRLDQDSACRRAAVGDAGIGAPATVAAAPPARVDPIPDSPPAGAATTADAHRDAAAAPSSAGGIAPAGIAPAAGAPLPAPRDWHVDPEGRDGAGGTADAPLRTLQDAADRAMPGDTILVHPGLYPDPVRFTRGGAPDRPITLRAATPGTVVLDGQRRHDVPIDLDGAPFIAIRDLEVRWYRLAGIRVVESPDVTVAGCRIWNAHWGGTWPTGTGIEADRSPRLRAERNLLFAQERGIYLLRSPQAVIRHNTAVGNLYGGVQFLFSLEGSVLRDNSLAFQGNDAMVIAETPAGRDLLARFDCDRNNYGMTLRELPEGTVADRITPRPIDRHLAVPSKALIYYEEQPGSARRFESLAAWRAFSGRDAHSIAADPLFVRSAARDFRLEPASPNRGAGSDGGTIGALE